MNDAAHDATVTAEPATAGSHARGRNNPLKTFLLGGRSKRLSVLVAILFAAFGTTAISLGAITATYGTDGAVEGSVSEPVATGIALDGSVQLAWRPVTNATSYHVYRGTSPTAINTEISPVGGVTATTFTDSTSSNGTIYYYAIRAASPGGVSAPSPTVEVQPRGRACSTGNPVVLENCFPGNSNWNVRNSGSVAAGGIEGYATATSINKGQAVGIKVNSDDLTNFRIEIYRMGYYGGAGARLFSTIRGIKGNRQPACVRDDTTGLLDCANWSTSFTLTTSSSWPSGMYMLRLVREDNASDNHVILAVRDDSRASDLLYGYSATDYQAYNNYGGKSLYDFNSTGVTTVAGTPRAVKVSFDRPYEQPRSGLRDWYTRIDSALVTWLEREGYDVTYQSDTDMERNGLRVRNHKAYVMPAHDEYYSAAMRSALESARDAGVHIFSSGSNQVYWKIRFENSPVSGGQDRVQVNYKSTQSGIADPSGIPTGTWRDPAGANKPENGLLGTLYVGANTTGYFPLTVSATEGQDRVWRNTGLETQPPGGSVSIGRTLVGWEWDQRMSTYAWAEPAGVKTLATSTVNGTLIQNHGAFDTAPGQPTTTQVVKYLAPSGALVFHTGTNHWSRGLALNAQGEGEPDSRIQQATVNVFTDMSVCPQTLSAGVVLDGACSTVTRPARPTGVIAQPMGPDHTHVQWQPVAGAEGYNVYRLTTRRTDGEPLGQRANPTLVTGTTFLDMGLQSNTTYYYVVTTVSGGVQSVASAESSTTTPAAAGEATRINTGGPSYTTSTGLVFGADNFFTGGQTNATTSPIAGTNEPALYQNERWGQFSYAIPVAVGTYDVRFHLAETYYGTLAPGGAGKRVFGLDIVDTIETGSDLSGIDIFAEVGKNTALVKTVAGVMVEDGVLDISSVYGAADDPTVSAIEVVPTNMRVPPTVKDTLPLAGATDVSRQAQPRATFSREMDGTTIDATSFSLTRADGTLVPATVSYDAATHSAVLAPSAPLEFATTYTARLHSSIMAADGEMLAEPFSWSFTTQAPVAPVVVSKYPVDGSTSESTMVMLHAEFSRSLDPATINDTSFTLTGPDGMAVMAMVSYDDVTRSASLMPSSPLALGTTYTAKLDTTIKAVDGVALAAPVAWSFTTTSTAPAPPTVTAKSPAPGAVDVLTNATVEATFSREMYAPRINGDTFTLSGPQGKIEATVAYDSATRVAKLTPALPLASSTTYTARLDGMMIHAADGEPLGEPVTWSFTTAGAPTVTSHTPPGETAFIPRSTAVTATFSRSMDPASLNATSFTVRGPDRVAVAATIAYDDTTRTATLTPSSPLAGGTDYTVQLDTSVRAADGAALASPVTWSFSTAACPCTLFSPLSVPAKQNQPVQDGRIGTGPWSYELGVKVTVDQPMKLTALRFYKSPQETGTHIGKVWTATGTQLATATFANETGSGWQQQALATPLVLQPNTVYVLSTNFNTVYSATVNGLATQVVSGPLRSVADGKNGVVGDAAGLFPTKSFSNSNYFVDFEAVFDGDPAPPTATVLAPMPDATNVLREANVSATFSRSMEPSTINGTSFTLTAADGTSVPATVAYDDLTRRATLTPSSPLKYSTRYDARLTTKIRARDGMPLSAPVDWSFTTMAAVPPKVTLTSPAANAGAVGPAVSARAEFSKSLDAATVNSTTFTLTGPAGAVEGAVSYADGTKAATFAPSAPLAPGTYTARLDGSILAADGAPLTDAHSWSFTVDTGGSVSVTSTSPADGASYGPRNGPIKATFSRSLDPASLAGAFTVRGADGIAVAAKVAYDEATRTASLTPNAPLNASSEYTAQVSTVVKAADGSALSAPATWKFTTAYCPCSLLAPTSAPARINLAAQDGRAGSGLTRELGVKVVFDEPMQVTALRFWKDNKETGTHVGRIWTAAGTQIASVTYATETASGWQQQKLDTPVVLQANTVYVISINTNMFFAQTNKGLLTQVISGPIRSVADGRNGVFSDAAGQFPAKTFDSTNYFVDLEASPDGDPPAPSVTSTVPANAATAVVRSAPVKAVFSRSMDPATITASTFTVRGPDGKAVPATVAYDDATRTATLTPTVSLRGTTLYTAELKGVLARDGKGLASAFSWTFETAPSYTITEPLAGAAIRNGQPVSASPPDESGSGIKQVEFRFCATATCPWSSGASIGTDLAAPFSVNWTGQPADGTYTIVARATDNLGGTSDSEPTTVTIDNTLPTATLSLVEGARGDLQHTVAGTHYYNPAAAGDFSLAVSASDNGSGVKDVSFPAVAVAGFTGAALVDAAAPFASNAYGFTADNAVAPAALDVVVSDKAGNTVTRSIALVRDVTAPSGGAVSYLDGYAAGSVSITTSEGTDTESGLAGGGTLERDSAPLAAGVPGAFAGTWTAVSSPDTALDSGTAYRYRYSVADRVGNVARFGSPNVVKVDTSAPAAPSLALTGGANASVSGSTVYFRPGSAGGFTVAASSSDAESGIEGYGFPSLGSGWTSSGGAYSFDATAGDPVEPNGVTARNNAGLSSSATSFTVTADGTAPVSSILCDGLACREGWYATSPVSVTLDATDTGSGLDRIRYTTDGSDPRTSSTASLYTGAFSVSATTTVKVAAFDRVGNVEDVQSKLIRIDTQAPSVTIDAKPSAQTNSATASFSFSSEPGATFECRIDGGSFEACVSPKQYTGLADGQHTFSVRATDAAGNTGAIASAVWTIDTVAPAATITAKPTDPTNATSASFGFSSEPGATFQCRIDGGAWEACASPKQYVGLTEGSHLFQVRAIDSVGNTGAAASFSWTVDTTAPAATITAKPADPTSSTSASFSFASETGATFQVSVDGGAFAPATSPKLLTGLGEGTHSFAVKATDAAGNTGAVASYSWTVDTTAPQTTIDASPALSSSSPSASFQFSGSEVGSRFECRLDGGAWEPCASPKSYSALAEGTHTFEVRATDAAGNVDPTPATFTWTIDTTGPATAITERPAELSSSSSATFAFTSDAGATFAYSLDGAAFKATTSPLTLTGLADGSHTFTVQATDAAGNTGAAATVTWTIDTVGPTVTLGDKPAALTSSTSASFSFSSEAGATFEVSLDGSAFAPATSPKAYTGLADGQHTFRVRAKDAAGNTGATVSHGWTIDTAGPSVTITDKPASLTTSTSASFAFTSETGATFEISLDGSAFAPATSPKAYTGLADGEHTFQVRASDSLGNTGAVASHSWTVDAAGAAVTITQKPASLTRETSASFSFTSEPGATFEVSLDGSAFAPATSPKAYTGLADGQHTFQVRAKDAAGNTGATESYSWTVDTQAPATTITSAPADPTSETTASFAFVSDAGVKFEVAIDGGAFEAASSPKQYVGLAAGRHTFQVRATDQAGNVGPVASRSWLIDTTAPSTPSLSYSAFTNATLVGSTIFFRPGATGGFTVAASSSDAETGIASTSYPSLGLGWSNTGGAYAFAADAVDPAEPNDVTATNGAGLTSAATSFTVNADGTAPVSSILCDGVACSDVWYSTRPVSIALSASDFGSGVAEIKYTFDGSDPSPLNGIAYVAPFEVTGSATIKFRAYDKVGNAELVGTRQIRIDATAPSAPSLRLVESSDASHADGTTLYYNPSGSNAGSFAVEATATDAESGIKQILLPSIAGMTRSGSSYSWTSSTSAVGPQTVEAENNAGLKSSSTFTLAIDTTAPAGGSISYANGYDNDGSVALATVTGSDSGSGIATSFVERQTGSLVDGVCTFSGAWTRVSSPDTTVESGKCYRYRLVVSDNVGNTAVYTSDSVVKVDTAAPSAPALTLTEANAASYADGTTLYYNPTGTNGGSFTLAASSTSSSGISKVVFPAIAGATGGGEDTTAPYEATYTWTSGTTAVGAHSVVVHGANGTTSRSDFTLVRDVTAPSGQTISVAGGWYTNASIAFTTGSGSDGQSGLDASTLRVERASATLANGECGPLGDFAGSYASPDTSVLSGRCYVYRVSIEDKVGNRSVAVVSATAKVDLTAPVAPSVTLTESAAAAHVGTDGAVYFRPGASGGFTATAAATDPESGVASYSFPTLGSGWTGTQTGASASFSFDATAGDPAEPNRVTATNAAGLTSQAGSFTVTADGTAPADGSVSYDDGYRTAASVAISLANGSDLGSGVDAATERLERASATLADGTCGTLGAFALLATDPALSTTDTSVLNGNCYVYRYVVSDNVGNEVTYTSTAVAKVDTEAPSATLTDPGANLRGTVQLASTTSDAVSGIASVKYERSSDGGATWVETPAAWDTTLTADGLYDLRVVATDRAGNVTRSAVVTGRRVDNTAPSATMSDPGAYLRGIVTLSSTTSDGGSGIASVTYQRSNAGANVWTETPATWDTTTANDGQYDLRVVAVDNAGNRTVSAPVTGREVDNTASGVTISSKPSNPTQSTSASFAFSSESGSTFEVSLDGGAWEAATSPKSYSGLAEGSHTFKVRATDKAGNTGTAETYSWTIDLTAPETTLSSTPSDPSSSSSASFAFSSTDTGASFECQLDGGAWTECTSPKSVTGLADGSHTFSVRAKDAAGNVDATPATHTWTIKTANAPVVTATTPADGATGVTRSTSVTATFDQAMDAATITASSFTLAPVGGTAVAATVSYDATTNKATLVPSAPLAGGTSYVARLATSIESSAGIALASPVSWTFTVLEAPTAISTSPADDSTNVAYSVKPSVTFSRAMDATSLNTTTFTMRKPDGTAVSGTVSYSAATLTATYVPYSPLDYSKTYTLTVSTAVKAADGEPIAAPFSWSFTTSGDAVTKRIDSGSSTTPYAGYEADGTYVRGGLTRTSANAINNTTDDALYQSERYGAWTYTFNIPNGTYDVKLHFAETLKTASGQRVFHVDVLETALANDISNLDLFAVAGANNAYTRTISGVSISTSTLRVRGVATTAGDPVISAIEILPQKPTVTARTPAANATGIATTTKVTATFSRTMDASSIDGSTVTLRNTTTGALVNATVTYDVATRVATLTPSAALARLTKYTAEVSGSVRASDGMTAGTPTTWSFTTS